MSSHPLPSPSDPIAALVHQVAFLSTQLAEMRNRLDHSSPSASSRPTHDNNNCHHLKLDVPRFAGSDTHGWISKISQFFTYHHTPAGDRITIASSYLDGAARAWYQWMYQNGQIASWSQFLEKLEIRFPPQPPQTHSPPWLPPKPPYQQPSSQHLSYFPSSPQPPSLPSEEPPPEKPSPSPVTYLFMKRKCDIESGICIGKETENEKIEDNLILGPPPWEPPPYLPPPYLPPPWEPLSPPPAPPPKILSGESDAREKRNLVVSRFSSNNANGSFEEHEKRENNFGSVSGEEIKLPNDAKAWKDKVISQPSIESTKQSQLFLINPQTSICANPLPQMSLQHVATSLKKLESLEPCALTAFWAPPICAPHDGWLASGPQAFVFNGYTSPGTQIVNSLGGMHLTQLLKNQQIIGVTVQIRIDNYDFIWAPRSIIGAGEDTIGLIENLDFGFSYLTGQLNGFFSQSPNLEDKVDFEGVGNDMILGLLRMLDRSIIRIGIG